MRFTKTQAYQHLANRNREGEQDLEDKFDIIRILRKYFGLYGLTGEIIMIDEDACRLPDILIKGNPIIVIELDGEIHGSGDEVSKREKDIIRNSDYLSIGVNLIIINKEATKGYQKDKVIQVLSNAGLQQK